MCVIKFRPVILAIQIKAARVIQAVGPLRFGQLAFANDGEPLIVGLHRQAVTGLIQLDGDATGAGLLVVAVQADHLPDKLEVFQRGEFPEYTRRFAKDGDKFGGNFGARRNEGRNLPPARPREVQFKPPSFRSAPPWCWISHLPLRSYGWRAIAVSAPPYEGG